MTRQLDEKEWPDLTKFRDACLAEDFEEMERIAARNHDWYANENPDGLPMNELAAIFQTQWYAAEGALDSLRKVLEENPWTINRPWTAQGWLPISQAASAHGDQEVIEYLLEKGADPTLSVGSPDDRATVVEMARYGKNPELADWLAQIVEKRRIT